MRAIARARMFAIATAISCAVTAVAFATPAQADTAPPDVSQPVTVSADALPTVQVNGVVWSQVVVGNTVYVGGEFTSARPAGAAAGTNETPRRNMLAYDLTTGNLITSFNPSPNAKINQLVASPDGTRVYAVGAFTNIAGATRNRAASFDTATNALNSWAPSLNYTAYTVAATNDKVWLGGSFSSANGQARPHFAAYTKAGALLPWAPSTSDGNVRALVVNPAGTKVVVGGSFTSVNGSTHPGYGLAALDATSGEILPWAVNEVVRNGGPDGGIFALSTDGNSVYGTGYMYGQAAGTLEGTFKAAWSDGSVQWIEDCHGDTYAAAPTSDVVYTAGHAHYCGNTPGGFPQTEPNWTFYRGIAFSQSVAGPATRDQHGYHNWEGTPAPRLLYWYPDINSGTYTGINQGPWHVTTSPDGRYVLYAGEFTKVNGKGQQGLVRFANPNFAPNKVGPKFSGATSVPTALALASDAVRVNWAANYDYDNESLKYEVLRNNVVIFTTNQLSQPWNRPAMGYLDTAVTPGSTVSYRIRATDPKGNVSLSDSVSVTTVAGASLSAYQRSVLETAANYWPLDEPAGPTAVNWAANNPESLNGSFTRGDSSAIGGAGASTSFGADGWAASSVPVNNPQSFSLEAWIKTSTTQGGKIIGFGNSNTGNSNQYDRHLYMQNDGRVTYGLWQGWAATMTTPTALNDGQWHHLVATTTSTGSRLYVDGELAASRADANAPQPYTGYWRIGGDNLGGWPAQPSSQSFAGSIDEVATYTTPLDAATVRNHNALGRTGAPANQPPTAAFAATPSNLAVAFDGGASTNDGPIASYAWNFGDGSTGTGATVNHTYAAAGSYPVTLTVTDAEGLSSSTTKHVALTSTAYQRKVLEDASDYWPLNEASGNDAHEWVAGHDGTYSGGVTHGGTPAISGDPGSSISVDRGGVASDVARPGPRQFSVEAWFKTSSTSGGKIVGFGNSNNGWSSAYDRHIYMLNDGRLRYGIYDGTAATITTSASYNDDAWHQVVATTDASGSKLYIDGALVGTNPAATSPQGYDGYWRIGGDNLGWWPDQPSSDSFTGSIDDVSVYPSAIDAAKVLEHYSLATGVVPNVAPTAAFTNASTELDLSVDGSSSTDSDGTIASYTWNFGDGSTGTGATASHTYAAAGTYTITLTVTDNDGTTATTSKSVTVTLTPVNQAPTASFAATGSNLAANVDGSGSNDPDGSISSFAWNWGDSATGTGATASHTYAAAGTYTITLTVTDNQGATATTTRQITVEQPPAPTVLAQDDFARTTTGNLGTATVGGAWTGSNAGLATNGSTGNLTLKVGQNLVTTLNSVTSSNVDLAVKFALNQAVTGTGVYVSAIGRQVGADTYVARVRVYPNGVVNLQIQRSGVTLVSKDVTGLTHTVGQQLNLRFQAFGTAPTTLRANVWPVGATEPATWLLSTTDSTAALQTAGVIGLGGYLGGTATSPLTIAFDDLVARPAN